MMGVGKTTVGRHLARFFDSRFLDSDEEICRSAGMPIPDIFSSYGEPAFRDLEYKVIDRLLGKGPAVISRGGGALTDARTRHALLTRSCVIRLDASIDDIAMRVSRTQDTRPNLVGESLLDTLARLIRERERFYSLAHRTFHAQSGQSSRQLAFDIATALLDGTSPTTSHSFNLED
jgi:shikimate kinase